MDDRTGDAGEDRSGGDPGAGELARGYYRAIDDGDYDALRDLLAPDFRQVRGDRTLDGREAFVRFMRDERPETDTIHVVDGVFVGSRERDDGGAGDATAEPAEGPVDATAEPADVLVQGRLHRADGSLWFRYVDAFAVANGALTGLRTYTH